jgi:hypothetical protein
LTPDPELVKPPFDIEFALKGIVGTASPVLGIVTSFQEQIEWHLRIASLLAARILAARILLFCEAPEPAVGPDRRAGERGLSVPETPSVHLPRSATDHDQ